MSDQPTFKICVVGAGVVGLMTATMIQESFPKAQVTLFADKFFTETTSDGAAGVYRPGLNFQGPSPHLTMKWLQDSYDFYNRQLSSMTREEAEQIGLLRKRFFCVSNTSAENIHNVFMQRITTDYRPLSEEEIRAVMEGATYKYGFSCSTTVTECRKYQPYLANKFKGKGGKVICRKIESFEEISDDFDLVFNCTGLGARQLCGDLSMVPIRGQVFKVKAPWIKDIIYVDSDTYIIPVTDGVVTLGGVRQFDSTNQKTDRHDSAAIWERCTEALPSLNSAQVLREWVGLRPFRPKVRVEAETFSYGSGKSIQVIHNYGHGGYGVMSAPGTSKHAVDLGVKVLQGMTTSKL